MHQSTLAPLPPDAQVTPEASIPSRRLCHALFELYVGTKPVSEDARKVLLAGARALDQRLVAEDGSEL